jgi:hypothetical protein
MSHEDRNAITRSALLIIVRGLEMRRKSHWLEHRWIKNGRFT